MKRDKPTRCDKSDVYYQTSISTCFGLTYVHYQENKTVYYCIWCSALVVLAVVVWSWVVSCVQCGCVELGRNPAEVVGFFGHLKNPPHAFLRRGSERICPMSQLCGM